MSIFRVALLTTAVVVLLPPSRAKADDIDGQPAPTYTIEAQFLGGSDKTITAGTFGTLNLKDTNELRFQYGTSVFHLPYMQITETDLAASESKGHWLVHMPGRKRFETLAITYHDSNGAENTVNFQVSQRVGAIADNVISHRRRGAEAAAADPDSFWGDKVWKTKRTMPQWEQQKSASTLAASGRN